MNQIAHHRRMLMPGKFLLFILFESWIYLFQSVMYRKFKENKDNEYEKIIRRQVNESKLVAEQEGISIPKTLEDYVAPSRAAATGTNSKKTIFSLLSQEDDDIGIDVSIKKNITKNFYSCSFKG
jgi:hypothetical protein